MPPIARCFGTEPFWTLEIAGGHWWLDRPDADPVAAVQTHATATLNDRRAHAFGAARVGDGGGSDGNGAGMHLLTLGGTCSDGMSDRAYGLSAWLTVDPADGDAALLTGCCALAP